jgi:hypothetical protein
MDQSARRLLAQLLRLDVPVREEIAAELAVSLEERDHFESEAWWNGETQTHTSVGMDPQVLAAGTKEPVHVFVVTYEYSEVVGAEVRKFVHEMRIQAQALEAAHAAALDHFDYLGSHTGVGWTRTLERCRVARELS